MAEFQRRFSKGLGFQVFYTLVNSNKAASHGWYNDSSLAPASSFLPGEVPADHDERARLLWYQRDTTVPQHEVRWNWIAELPFGKGKPIGANANKFLDAFIGGWQVTGMGRWRTNWLMLPTNIWPTGTPVEYYGHKYPIEDCRSGVCRPGYLLWNGYIPAHQINSTDPKTGNPNGVMGVPSSYKPAAAPVYPYPADYASRNAANDPNYTYYGNNYAWIPLTDTSTPARVNLGGTPTSLPYNQPPTGSPLHPWINQPLLSTALWNCDASISKNFSIKERARLRLQFDFFNVFNVPGDEFAPPPTTASSLPG